MNRYLTRERMHIIQITPGAGAMYCGNCLRDNAMVAALRRMGHEVVMVPLYLPLTLDEPDESAGTPVFFGGINVYLDQKFPLFRKAPWWLHEMLAWRPLLRWAGTRAAKTRASELGELTISMLRGESGNQARELSELITWLKTQPGPDIICLSNALLTGLARRLKAELGCPVVCMLQGEDTFLDALPESHREACWRTLAERAADVDRFITPTRYFAEWMGKRLGLGGERVSVVYNGINLQGYEGRAPTAAAGGPPVIGYFARMCREKGLEALVEAYILLRKRGKAPAARLRVGGSCGPTDEVVVAELKQRLASASLLNDVEFFPNQTRDEKIAFLKSLSVFSVPAVYGEAFGLYLLEAMAAGVPVVQPRAAAFPELIEATGGGVLCAPGDPQSLADALEGLLVEPERARALGEKARNSIRREFTAEAMARKTLKVFEEVSPAHLQPMAGLPHR